MKKAIAYIGIVVTFVLELSTNAPCQNQQSTKNPPENPYPIGLMYCVHAIAFVAPGDLLFMKNPQTPILSPGIEEAIKSFLANSDDVSSIVESLTYIFNSFLATDEFTNLTRLDRTNYSYDFHQVLDLMQTLKLSAQKSGYIISPDGITEGIAA